MDFPVLKTSRLMLRAFEMTDAPEVQKLAGHRSIAEMTMTIPHPYEDGCAEKWIETHPEEFKQGRSVNWAVTCREGGHLIGAISMLHIQAGHRAEIGYWIGVPYWNQGFCSEAAAAVVTHGFNRMGLIRIFAVHFQRNPASGRILQKIGMRHEGSLRQHVVKWDRTEDLEIWGILKSEHISTQRF